LIVTNKARNDMKKPFYGVGRNSKRQHKTKLNNKHTEAYRAWHHMLTRCYSPKTQAINPTYIGCSISEVWHDFQDFADWFYSHPYSGLGYQLDKDLLVTGNKVYSPETCCFVPQEINLLLNNNGINRGEHPQGVSWHKATEKYLANIAVKGKTVYLGVFNCAQEAHQAYRLAKEQYVKEKALEWQDRIDTKVFDALISWRLNNSN